MHLVQILLPLYDNDGNRLPAGQFREVRAELAEAFGGVTVYSRAPAEGLWKEYESSPPQRDDLVLFEVMVQELDRGWWTVYREDSRSGSDRRRSLCGHRR